MKLNSIKKYPIILICACFMSCSDFLNMDPTDTYTDDSFWKTSSQAVDAINACYRALNEADLYGATSAPVFYYETLSPNAYHKDNDQEIATYARGAHTSTTLGMNVVTWRGCYRGIGRCNNVIDKVPAIEMDETLKKRIIGEAKFLRALYYWTLNAMFGGVPLILTSPNMEEHGKLPRNTHAEVVAQIIKDLDEAVPVLETKYVAAQDGRATKGAALTLKARVLLQNHDYPGTAKACEDVFALNRYELFPDYNGIFRQANIGNSEVIFDVRWLYPTYSHGYDIFHGQYQTQTPVQGLIDAYQMIDGKSIHESPLYNPENPFENRDPRLDGTVVWIGKPWRARIALATELFTTGYAFTKFTEYSVATTSAALTGSINPYVVLRYADVLMMYAEALNEIEGATEKVYKAVNDVRGRISVEMPPLPAGLSKEAMREAIRLERRIEFAGEGYYYHDIRRWGIAQDVMNDAYVYKSNLAPDAGIDGGSVGGQRKFRADRDYLFPIPYTQIDLNPNLVQNPGY